MLSYDPFLREVGMHLYILAPAGRGLRLAKEARRNTYG